VLETYFDLFQNIVLVTKNWNKIFIRRKKRKEKKNAIAYKKKSKVSRLIVTCKSHKKIEAIARTLKRLYTVRKGGVVSFRHRLSILNLRFSRGRTSIPEALHHRSATLPRLRVLHGDIAEISAEKRGSCT